MWRCYGQQRDRSRRGTRLSHIEDDNLREGPLTVLFTILPVSSSPSGCASWCCFSMAGCSAVLPRPRSPMTSRFDCLSKRFWQNLAAAADCGTAGRLC